MARIPALMLCLGLAACAGEVLPRVALACPAGTQPMTRVDFFFGGNIGAPGGVPEGEWRGFLDTEVTPRFPDGFSVVDVYGQWRDAMGRIEAERSKNLIVLLRDVSAYAAPIAALRDSYRARFRQQSVLYSATPLCAGF